MIAIESQSKKRRQKGGDKVGIVAKIVFQLPIDDILDDVH